MPPVMVPRSNDIPENFPVLDDYTNTVPENTEFPAGISDPPFSLPGTAHTHTRAHCSKQGRKQGW